MKQKDVVSLILKCLPDKPCSYDTSDNPGFWADGDMIFCPTESECSILAGFLSDMLSTCDGNMKILTGHFDASEDVQNGECDEYTGFYYVEFE